MAATPLVLADLTERVRFWQSAFGLDHWAIKITIVEECEGEPDAAACVLRSADYDIAEIQFSERWLDEQSPYERDITICHELMHVHLRDLDEAINWLLDHTDESVSSAASARIGHEGEGIVDRIARVVVRSQRNSATLAE